MKKVIFSLMLMAFTSMSMMAYDFVVDGIYYEKALEDNAVLVTFGDEKYSGDLVIPEAIEYDNVTYSVTGIGDLAFEGCHDVTSITIPNSVTSIGYYAIGDCPGLTSIEIPEGVTTIDNEAIVYCTGLTSIQIPSSVTSIGLAILRGCTALTSITVDSGNANYDSRDNCNAIIETASNKLIAGCEKTTFPNSVTAIGNYAFAQLTNLRSIEIPENITSIGSYAFRSCSGLESIIIPSSVTDIGTNVFIACSGLTSIAVADGNPNYDSRDNCNAIIETASNKLITGCENTVIPSGVTSIGDYAFYESFGLTSIDIPSSVTKIGKCAFYNCYRLASATLPNSITELAVNTFYGCSGLASIDIPNSVTSIGQGAFFTCHKLSSIDIPNSVTTIGDWAFYQCSALVSACIGESITNIGRDAFSLCEGLKEVTCLSTTVPTGAGIFFNSNIESATLIVPDEAYEAYSTTFPWRDFGTIKTVSEATEDPDSMEVTIGPNGIATNCVPYDLDFSGVDGLKAYIATGYNGTTGNLIVQTVDEAPAGTGLLLKGAPGTYEVPCTETNSYFNNLMVGVTEATTIEATEDGMTNFLLADGENGVGFYAIKSYYTIGANKAYLQLPTLLVDDTNANFMSVEFDDDTTGIDHLQTTTDSTDWYTLDGRRLGGKPAQKGIYVVNGKKVVVK